MLYNIIVFFVQLIETIRFNIKKLNGEFIVYLLYVA